MRLGLRDSTYGTMVQDSGNASVTDGVDGSCGAVCDEGLGLERMGSVAETIVRSVEREVPIWLPLLPLMLEKVLVDDDDCGAKEHESSLPSSSALF